MLFVSMACQQDFVLDQLTDLEKGALLWVHTIVLALFLHKDRPKTKQAYREGPKEHSSLKYSPASHCSDARNCVSYSWCQTSTSQSPTTAEFSGCWSNLDLTAQQALRWPSCWPGQGTCGQPFTMAALITIHKRTAVSSSGPAPCQYTRLVNLETLEPPKMFSACSF